MKKSLVLLSLVMSILFFFTNVNAATVYRIDANSDSPPVLHEYDPAANLWAIRAALPANNTTQLASDGNSVFALPEDGNIYRYDPGTNSWVFVQAGPAASVGRNAISMLETHNGEFYWGNDGTNTLYYTVGGVWSSIATPRTISSGAGIDRTSGQIYIRAYGQLGFFVYDTATNSFPTICDNATGVGENSRVGVYYNGFFYSRTWSGNLISFDAGTCASSDTGIALATYHASTDVDSAGNIYLNGYGGTEQTFEVFSISGNSVTPLANAPLYGSNAHPSLAVVDVASQPDLIVSSLAAGIRTFGTPMIRGVFANYMVMNQGSADAVSSCLDFYLSRDAIIDPGDVYLGRENIPGLTAGNSYSGFKDFRRSFDNWQPASGTWRVIADADACDDNEESDETNNQTSTVAAIVK